MDEPTNDLDVETLEILEDLLLDYDGTLLLVSHDRAFLNNIVTSTLAMDGSGKITETIGGYDEWLRRNESAKPESKSRKAVIGRGNDALVSSEPSKKSGYKKQRTLEAQKREPAEVPKRIEKLETDVHALTAELDSPAFYTLHGHKLRFLKELKTQGEQRIKIGFVCCRSFLQAL